MIRPKLILAFVAMALMTAFCGAVGVVFVDRIGRSVSVFSELTSPALTEGLALADNAQRMRALFLHARSGSESDEAVARKLEALHAAGHAHLDKLRDLAGRLGIDPDLEAVAQREDRFLRLIEVTLAAHRRELAAVAATKERADRSSAQHRAIEALLLALINRTHSEINRLEDSSKVEVQTGAATVDGLAHMLSNLLNETFPVLNNTGKLLAESRQVADVVERLLPGSDSGGLDALEQRTRARFKAIGSVTRKLAGRLRSDEGRSKIDRIRQSFAGLEAAVLGEDGVFANQRKVLAARSEVETGQGTLAEIEANYLRGLDEVVRAVTSVNHAAREDAGEGILQARSIIIGSVVFTLLAGLGLGLFFAHRLSAPVIRLADHAAAISKGGELAPLPDADMTGRADELGKLSRSFNQMIGELAAARKRLIEWSEAEIRTQYERLNAAINNMPQGLCMFDAEQNLIISNRRYAEIYSVEADKLTPGTPLRALLEDHIAKGASPDGADGDYVIGRLAAVSEGKPYYHINEMRDGHVIAISYQPMAGGGSVTTHEDITERRKVEAKIAYMAHHDALTDLPNRVSFRERMEAALTQVARDKMLAVLCLDLDHFKSVNDTLGHPVGDTLLQAVAQRIRVCLRGNDVIARLGGDEFAIVQVAVDQPVGATALAARLIKTLSDPFDLGGNQVVIGASIGIAVAPGDGSDPDRLLKNADMALYRAKEDGRGIYRFFEPEMDARMQRRRTLELDLRRAVVTGEFELFYQPTVNLETGKVTSFEALIRWHHPQRGLLLPEEFVSLSEEIGLINSIGAWVLKEACREAVKWPEQVKVAVNLSPVQFKSGTLVLDVIAALGASGLAPGRLELEITETVLLQDTELTVNTLNQLRDLGAQIAMDDFGTGYSSLAYLSKFPFDKIKIDRSFIHNLSRKPDSIAIVRAVAGLSSALGMTTTAEGVETAEQLAKMKAEGCTEVQGFVFSEARPAAELESLLQALDPGAKAVA